MVADADSDSACDLALEISLVAPELDSAQATGDEDPTSDQGERQTSNDGLA